MAYGNYNRGNYGGSNGGYQRNNYGGNQQGGYQQGGYQQQAPQPQLIDVHQEIVNRIELYQQFKQVAVNELGVTDDEFIMMAPMLGGWVTSILLKQEKGK